MAASDLVQLAEVKSWLGIISSADDALLQTLITQISAWADGYTNRTLYSTTYTIECDGRGEQRKILPNWPVTAVSSVVISGVNIPVSPDAIQPGYIFNTVMPRVTLVGYTFTKGLGNVFINYTAGFSVFPQQLVLAAKQLVAARYRGRTSVGKISASGPAGQSASYFTKDEATPEILRILDSYRRVTPW